MLLVRDDMQQTLSLEQSRCTPSAHRWTAYTACDLSTRPEERGVTQRRIDWSSAHADDWERSIREGDRRRARELYEAFGDVLLEEIREEGGSPVLSDPATNRRIRRRLYELPPSDGVALDLGCGPTPVAAMSLRDLGWRTIGLDVAHSICTIARQMSGGTIPVVVGDAEHLPFRDGAFEVVTCDDTIEHVFEQDDAVRELGRTVQPGGRVLLVTPNASGFHVLIARARDLARGRRKPRSAYHITQSHVRELRWNELVKMFRPWFRIGYAEAIPFGGGSRRTRMLNRLLSLPGGWRFGWTLFVEFVRGGRSQVASGEGAGALGHYRALQDRDSQTSPTIVQRSLASWLDRAPIVGPVLDLGTGVGSNLRQIIESHVAVGADVSLAAACVARDVAPVVVCDAAHLPFRGGAFGAIVCTEVLEHVHDPRSVLGEAARVLRTDGLLYLTTPNYANVAGLHKFIADRGSGARDWNPWGAHKGGFEAFMTGRKMWSLARQWFDLERVRGHDFGQAITGRFAPLDKAAWSRGGRAILRRVLPRLEGTDGALAWFGMHTELVLRKSGHAQHGEIDRRRR
jgi:SAM-dependent methyltransferase